jgi:hypothetical protein
MTGTAIETQSGQALDVRDVAAKKAPTPTVIDVETYPVTEQRSSRTAILVDRGLALLSSLMRLALLWVENREEKVQRITPRQRTSTTPTARRSALSRGGGRRQRRRQRGQTNA